MIERYTTATITFRVGSGNDLATMRAQRLAEYLADGFKIESVLDLPTGTKKDPRPQIKINLRKER